MPRLPINTLYYCYLFLRLGLILYSLYFIYKEKYLKGYAKRTPFVLGFLILIICVIAVGGDYWSYLSWYETGLLDEHVEPIWMHIKDLIPWNYSLFRAIVWGVGLILMIQLFDICNVDKALALCLFGSFYIVFYCYARASIALAFLLYGIIQFYRSSNKGILQIWRWILCFLFIVLGLLLHRSMFLIIPALLMPLFVKLNRTSFVILLVLFPVFSLLFNFLFPYLSQVATANTYFGENALEYLSLDIDKGARFWSDLLPRLPILLFYVVAAFSLNKCHTVPSIISKVTTAAFFILYTSFLFATVSEANGITFFYRSFNMAYPFMIVTITYSVNHLGSLRMSSLFFLVMVLLLLLIDIRYFVLINPNVIQEQMKTRYLLLT